MDPLFAKYNIEHISASQIKTILRSPFVWACQKLEKLESPPTQATVFGRYVHRIFEENLKGEEPSFEPTEEEAKFFAPAWEEKAKTFWKTYADMQSQGYAIETEVPFLLHISEDLPPIKGVIDLYHKNSKVEDFKTVGAKKYALDELELLHDWQMLIYAAKAFEWDPSAEGLYIQHTQLFKKLKRKPVALVQARVYREYVSQKMRDLAELCKLFLETLKIYDQGGLKALARRELDTYDRFAFGGCPYAELFDQQTKEDLKPILIEDSQMINLHELVGKARSHFQSKGLAKFDLADAIVASVVDHMQKQDEPIRVFVRAGMTNGGDLVYNNLLNQLAEKGVEIYERVT